MKDNHFLFTTCVLNKLSSTRKHQRFYDTQCRGLLLEITPAGTKIFRFRKKKNGEQQWSTIGTFPSISIDKARDCAIQLSAKLVDGEMLSHKDELTLGELATLYFEQYANDRCITANKMRQNWDRWWCLEQSRKLSQLDTECIQLRVNKFAVKGNIRTANYALATIRAILNWGKKRNLIKTNPAECVDKFKESSRERFIQPHEFEPLLNAINSYSDTRCRDFFLICLYTGARSGNVKTMTWEQIDFDLGTWRIPKTKNGESHTIQLSEQALSILRSRFANRRLVPWVFPGGNKGKGVNHYTEPKDAWKRITAKAGITDLHIHDLRRSLAAYMVMNNTTTATIMKQLGHQSLGAAQIYQRLDLSAAKLATDQAINAMLNHTRRKDLKTSLIK